MTLEEEVIATAGLTRYDRETEQAYLGRIVQVLDALPDPIWDQLSAQVKEWHVAAATALNANKPMPPLTGETEQPEKRVTVAHRVREIIFSEPKIHSRDLYERIIEEGFNTTYTVVQVECGHFRAALRFLKSIKALKNNSINV